MLTHINNSNTAIIVLHEIYGLNKHVANICTKLSECKYDVIAPNLLNGKGPFSYDQEELAYSYFMNNIGVERAMNQIRQIIYSIRPKYEKVFVLGYSIGATLAWLCSDAGLCDLIVGFYGSRIRDYLMVEPKCPGLLFVPNEEKSYDVDDLIESLNKFASIRVYKLTGQHGFADEFSKNYNKRSTLQAAKKISLFVKHGNFID
ncbi:MAG: dienelactone hydrolase [Firmicutes bacterium]|nr:dienelactone hydrolase [Bacillota bacterium]